MSAESGFHWLSLGGVGEIGKNCYVIETNGKLFVLDCGMAFPDISQFGIDIVIPDFSYLIKHQNRIAAVILTHGHEDHIGSVPYLLQDLTDPPPIYGSKFTLGLLRNKLKEFELMGKANLREYSPGDDFEVQGVKVRTARVTHSIPDCASVAVKTPIGWYLHSGDYKIDPTPVDGRLTDIAKLEEIGREGVALLATDTTNIERTGRAGSETSIHGPLRDYVKDHDGRVFVTTFASNIHRVQQAIDIAVELGRKVLVLGRTMVDNVAMSQDMGYLHVPPNVLIHPKDADNIKPHKLMVILTGSQGEPLAAIARMAGGEHRFLTVMEDDLFIFSSSPIPGNETSIYSVIDDLFRQGAEVIYGLTTGAHVSGHGNQEDIHEYLDVVRPRYILPIHGEFRMQSRFKKLVTQWGLQPDEPPVVSLGERWYVDDSGPRLESHVKAGEVFITGEGSSDITRRIINERLALAQDGILVFSIVLSAGGEEIVSGPDLFGKGFIPRNQAEELYRELEDQIREAVLRNRHRTPDVQLQLRNNVQNAIQRLIFQKTKINPVVIGMVSYAAGADSQTD